jgi:hypothetical protein
MVKKFNLSEAAAEILNQTVTGKRTMQDKSAKLSGAVAYGTKEVEIGQSPEKDGDENIDGTKGTPTATPPGATPPVGSEKDGVGATKPTGQPGESQGRSDLNFGNQADATSYEAIRDRIMGKKPTQTMSANKGATFQQYEEAEEEGEVVSEWKEEKETKKHEMKEKHKEKMKEDIDALLSGENLSEEFVTKATTIFEAAVVSRVAEIAEEVENELVEQFQTAIDEIKEDFSAKIDDYLNYVVEEWMKENELAIESGLRAEIVEDFISGLHNLFSEHYIDVPEQKVDVVEELAEKVEELESKLNEQIENNIEVRKELNEHKKIEAIHAACEGLSQTQVEKIIALAETVEFTTEEDFAEKVNVLKEAYASTSTVKSADKSVLEEGIDIEEEKKQILSDDPLVNMVAKSISKSTVK